MMQELNYIRCGDYYIPDIRLPKETRPIGRWGRMHRDYIKEHNPIRFNDLCLSGEVWTYLADLNEQAQSRLELIIEQMKASEGVTEGMKQHNQMTWVTSKCWHISERLSSPLYFANKTKFTPTLQASNSLGICFE
ncbi:MAG: TnpV protein [Dysosmobacter sp.]